MKATWSLFAAVLVAATTGASLQAAKPPPRRFSGVEIFGQPSRFAEVSGRPLGRTLSIFRSARLAARLPPPPGLMRPLSVVAAHMLGRPGPLIVAKTRRADTPAGAVYLVPTARGWVCMQGPRFETCHRGLLRSAVTWNFYSTTTGLDVMGIAADEVDRVVLAYGRYRRAARLHDNVFYLHRPITLSSTKHLPALGSLTISYRGTKPPVRVALR